MLALEPLAPADQVNGPMLGGGHEPGTRVVGYARLRPTFELSDECVLSGLLRKVHVAHVVDEEFNEYANELLSTVDVLLFGRVR